MKMYSRVYAKIDLDAIHHNMEAMHALLKEDTKIFAVIKTDGYGHGAVPIAKEIESLDYLFGYCTATVEEALILRNHGIKKPILILGYTFPEEYEDIVKNDLRPAVFTLEMAQELSDVAGRLGKDVYVHQGGYRHEPDRFAGKRRKRKDRCKDRGNAAYDNGGDLYAFRKSG